MRLFFILSLILICSISIANPAPFGLEVGRATSAEVSKKYRIKHLGTNEYAGGVTYLLDPKELNFQGLEKAITIFDKHGTLTAVSIQLKKSKFNDVLSSLSKKYQLIKKQVPPVGDKLAVFTDDEVIILIKAPHLSFSMDLIYATPNFIEAADSTIEEKKRQQRTSEDSKL